MIADRPADVEDRAIPGDWEGDLILGSLASKSSIGTLVERTSRLVVLFPLGQDRTAERTRLALAEAIQTLPRQMIRSITWDQGKEMSEHAQFSIAPESKWGSATPTHHGNAVTNETPTDCCASISPKAPTLQAPKHPVMPSPLDEHPPRKILDS